MNSVILLYERKGIYFSFASKITILMKRKSQLLAKKLTTV